MDTLIQDPLTLYSPKSMEDQLLSLHTNLELTYLHQQQSPRPSSPYQHSHRPASPHSVASPTPSGLSLARTSSQTSTGTSELSSLSSPEPERHVFALHVGPQTILPIPLRASSGGKLKKVIMAASSLIWWYHLHNLSGGSRKGDCAVPCLDCCIASNSGHCFILEKQK